MSLSSRHITVTTGSSCYDIHIGTGLLAQAGALLRDVLQHSKICIVTDETVAPLYLYAAQESLRAAGAALAAPVILPAGEAAKNFSNLERIIDHAVAEGLDRRSVLVALGGGVVGDITGFAAAVFMRGIPFIQVPTTLMAQVDSAVGGKTAVNTQRGKNMAGAFHQPALVLADTDLLSSLPLREVKAGYAEILKAALIEGGAFFDWLDENGAAVLARDPAAVADAVARACAFKAKIVEADPQEKTGLRALLNLGHTFGHALEALAGYDGRLLHGEAVAAGLRLAVLFSVEHAGLDPASGARVLRHMERLDLVQRPPFAANPAEMLDKMRCDKKAEHGKMTLVLMRGIGSVFVDGDVDENRLAEFLARHLQA